VPLADRKIIESIIEPKMTGNDLAAKYRAFTGRRVIVSAAAAAAEFAFVQEASPADPLTYGDAAKLIKMAALLEGFVFVPAGDIAPDVDKLMFSAASAGPKGEGIEVINETDAFPVEDRVIAYVMTFKFLKPDEAVRVFTSIIGQFGSYGSLAAIPNASAVIITEKTSLISKLIELKEVIDKPTSDVTTRFIKVQFADVTELAETLNQLLTAQQQSQQTAGVQRTDAPVNVPGGNNPAAAGGNRGSASSAGSAESVPVQIVPDSRTNRIFVMGRPVDVVFVEGLVREFDTQTSEKNFLRRKLSFLSASEFLPIAGDALTRAFSSNSSGGSGGGGGAGSTGANFGQGGAAGGGNRTTGSTSSGNRSTSSSRSSGSSSFGGSGGMGGTGGGGSSDVGSLSDPNTSTAPTSLIVGRTLLVADNITNSIIVQGPPAGLEIIEKLLDEVDVRADQVMISAVFGQLTLNDNLDYGVNVIRALDPNGSNKIGGGNVNPVNGASASTPNIPALIDPLAYRAGFANSGLNVYGLLSNQFNVYVNALQATGNFSVLSRPSIYTANNKKGVISSGQRIAVPTNSFNGGVGVGGQSTNIEYQDVVLKLEIIPLINSEKEVTLQIVLTSDERGEDQNVGELVVPNIITRSMTTTVTVPNNQTVVLGGLVVTRDRDSVSGIPILSSIPGLGKLFSTTSKDKEKSELLIFIQPSIVRTAGNLDRVQADMDQRYKVTPALRNFADGPGAIPPPDSIVPVNEKASDYSAAGPVKSIRGNTVVEEAPPAAKKTKRMGHPGR
jgi:type II secretion system protein D